MLTANHLRFNNGRQVANTPSGALGSAAGTSTNARHRAEPSKALQREQQHVGSVAHRRRVEQPQHTKGQQITQLRQTFEPFEEARREQQRKQDETSATAWW